MSSFTPKKIGNMRYQIDADSSKGMKVPVTIFADEKLLAKMMTDRTIQQALNVSTLPGIQQHAIVYPMVMKDMAFLLEVLPLWMQKRE